jgi:hypothetical protein
MLPSASGLLRRQDQRFLVHSYTRTPLVDGVEGDDGHTPRVPGTPVTGLPCLYQTVERAIRDASGVTTLSVPTLYVLPTDPLDVGMLVSDILDADGNTLLAGPLVVETINPYAEAGVSALKGATLRGAVSA